MEAAYLEFGLSGPEFSLKALAQKTNLPRATLYYHFDHKEHLIDQLLILHKSRVEEFLKQLRTEVKVLIPDLYVLMSKFKPAVLFHRQLLKNCHETRYCELYQHANKQSIHILLPLIKLLFDADKSDQEIIEFYNTLTDAWYIRLHPAQVNTDYMTELAIEIMDNTLGLYNTIDIGHNTKQ
nr:TetR/AcrR family transcriptional regulator [Carboxylicivirga mesophila]